MMKRGPQQREKRVLSAKGLLTLVRRTFEAVELPRTETRGKKPEISLPDFLMSGLALFSLKAPSLLSFELESDKPIVSHNLKTLYGIKQVPSDTHMRKVLDEVDQSKLRKTFCAVFETIQRGKLLERYRFFDGYLVLVDGTGFFESNKINCEDCCVKTHRDGKKTYYHQALVGAIVHPDQRQVITLPPEMISKQDGTEKNDCERRALQRFLASLKKEHPRLNATIACDALSANAPTINEILSYKYHFIINVKPNGNKFLFDWISGLKLEEKHITIEKNSYVLRYINGIPLNNAKDAPVVNFLECTAVEIKGKKQTEKTFTWVTNHKITDENAYLIMRGGRARWKIENETFNTLKNQGYQFEHNFGHGKKHLFSVFASLMLLAFLIDQIQEAACGLFQSALQEQVTRRSLWEKIRAYFYLYYIDSWESLFIAIHQSIGSRLSINTS